MLRNSGFTAGAPGYDVMAFVEPTSFPADFEEMPNSIIVGVGHGEVRVAPVHKITKSFGLFDLDG